MPATAEARPDLGGAIDRLIEACNGTGRIAVAGAAPALRPAQDAALDALDRGIAGVARIYREAAAAERPRRIPRARH